MSRPAQRASVSSLPLTHAAHTRSHLLPLRLAGLSSPTLDGLKELTRADSAADDSLHDVVHLSVPAVGESSPPDAPLASVFFFAGSAQELGACGHTCVSVWWGADPAFEQALLLDLRALHQLSKVGPNPNPNPDPDPNPNPNSPRGRCRRSSSSSASLSRARRYCASCLGLGLGVRVRVRPNP